MLAFTFASLLVFTWISAQGEDCEQLAKLSLPNVTVRSAVSVPPGEFHPLGASQPLPPGPAFCRIEAALAPSPDSDIEVELWLPLAGAWNKRLLGTGNGGFAGKIDYSALADGVRHGYAVVNTDMGMKVPANNDQTVFIDRPERYADWGYRSTHEMTKFAQQIVHAYYGQAPAHSYFKGCSTGGEQALMEAQRFPNDYDGILGGAPANDRVPLHISILWNFTQGHTDSESWLPPGKITLLSKAVTEKCDTLDGLKDGLISDPERCSFDPSTLICSDKDSPNCLTHAQVETVRRIYAGPVDRRTGQSIYPGLAKGSESGWVAFMGQSFQPNIAAPFTPIFRWVFGRDWDWRTFDYDRDVDQMNKRLGPLLNADDTNLEPFRASGHKLLLFHGWADRLVPPQETIDYYRAVSAKEGVATDDFFRLFLLPGVEHCSNGIGPDTFDGLAALVRWVEQRVAPDRLIATRRESGDTKQIVQRPLCPYPKVDRYGGKGDPEKEASFVCVLP
ncbi:MAG: tannase/feruloyl esterase family alpha/beta hydrolase [Acidobacteriaceae bacterium]|nr:tannase/feruloyl esterase family alpha/beta hydrolase [Acidobacteriaceae bacterium]